MCFRCGAEVDIAITSVKPKWPKLLFFILKESKVQKMDKDFYSLEHGMLKG